MASGSFNASILSGHYTLRVDWSSVADVASNTSKVTAVMYLVNNWSINVGTCASTTTIAGVTYNWTAVAVKNSTGSTHTTKLGTVTSGSIYHNTDGTKKIKISAAYNIKATIDGTYYESITASAEIDLGTIPRATQPTLSVTGADMGDRITINTPSASSAFTHDLAYSFVGGSYVSIATGVATSKEWTVPDVASSIPNATSGTMTIRCITKKGSTTIGTKTVLLTAKVPASVVPTISAVTATEATSGLAARFGAFIQSKSTIKAAITAAGAKGSTIKSYSTTFNGKTYSGSSWTSSAVISSGTLNLVTTVTDSRGRTAQKTTSISVLAYSPPKIQALSCYRVNASGAAADDGTYIAIRYKYSVTSLNGKNTAGLYISYKKSTDADTEYVEIVRSGALSADTTAKPSSPTFSVDNQYTVRAEVADWFAYGANVAATLPSGEVILDLKADGTGIAFGKTAERAGVDFGWGAKGAVLGLRGAMRYITTGDMNDLLVPGVYGFNNNAGEIANCPIKTAGTLRVWTAIGDEAYEGANTYLIQEVIPYLNDTPTCRRSVYSYPTAERTYRDWKAITLNGQSILWSGCQQMAVDTRITLSQAISKQSIGITLVFRRYRDGAIVNDAPSALFSVPKSFPEGGNLGIGGGGATFSMNTSDFSAICQKILYIKDTIIGGSGNNDKVGTANGITFDNTAFVLTHVLGI